VISSSFDSGIGNWTAGGVAPANKVIYDQAATGRPAQSGTHYLAMNASHAQASIMQDMAWPVGTATAYTASVYVRSQTGQPFEGELALYSMGGSGTTGSVTSFTAGAAWTPVSVTTPVTLTDQSKLRIQVRMNSLQPQTLNVDTASIVSNLTRTGSFEAGTTTGWGTDGVSGTNFAVYGPGHGAPASRPAVDGTWFAAMNGPASNRYVRFGLERDVYKNEQYSATLWVRASSGTAAGKLTLGESGTTSTSSTAFTVGADWKRVVVSHIATVSSTQLVAHLVETTPGVTVQFDGMIVR
jgi:hypothetical protein